MNKVILGTAFNYDYKQIELFLGSLARVFNGKVVLFTNRKIKIPIKGIEVEFVFWNPERQSALPVAFNDVINYRHYLYLDFLRRNSSIDAVMLSDVRDVFFQSDPFEMLDEKITVAVEDMTIEGCAINSNWIRTIFGQDYFDSVAKRKIICAGTTIGNYESILAYEEEMIVLLEKWHNGLDSGESNMVIDQAIHNYWCLQHKDSIIYSNNETGSILTMGHTQNFRFNREGNLINSQGEPYSVIHQFDRVNWVENIFNQKMNIQAQKERKTNIVRKMVNYLKG